MVSLNMGGCIFGPPPNPCETATDCDDDNGCTTDTCDVATGDCTNTALCDGAHCLTVTNDQGQEVKACVECVGDDDTACDDGVDCTTDGCDVGTCTHTADDAACHDIDGCTDDSCDATTGCANTQIDCDDAVACTDDGCDAGACTHTDNCAAGSTCNETTGECVLTCVAGDLCDDGDPCTDDECDTVAGACANTAKDCDDGVACTDDSCDAATGDCVHADNCTAPDTCNLTSGLCEAAVACTDDAGCDDGLFCNGLETCDLTVPAAGVCVDGARPCADTIADGTVGACGDAGVTESCAEGSAAAVCTPCPSPTLDFTLNADNLTGTTGNDTFFGPLLVPTGSGTQFQSLQIGDKANGLAGTDTLDAQLNGTTITPLQLADIETLNFTSFAATTINAQNISGVNTINSVSSVDDVTIAGLQEATDFGMSSVNSTGVDLSLTFGLAITTSGTADTITGTFSAVTGGSVRITTAATNGFETLALVSSGASANALDEILQGTGTSMVTCNISGTQALTLKEIPSQVLTVNASTLTGALQLGSGTTAANYVGFSTVDDGGGVFPNGGDPANNNMNNITGGTGNDTFIFGTTVAGGGTPMFDANDFDATGEALNGGNGTDVLQATFDVSATSGLRLTSIEEIRFNARNNALQVNLTGVSGLTTATIEADATANTGFELLNISGSPLPTLNFRGAGTQTVNQAYDGVTYSATGATGSSDTLAITIGNRGTAINVSGTTNLHTFGGTLTANQIETLNITVTDGPATLSGITASTLANMTLTASSNLTLGTVTATGDTIVSVNASAVTGNLNATINKVATGASITLGGGADILDITGSGGTSSSISGGAGNDTITGAAGNDVINGDAGTDTLLGAAGNDTINGGADNDTITAGLGVDNVSGGAGADVYRFLVADGLALGTDDITSFDTITFVKTDGDQIDCTNLVGAAAAMTYVETATGVTLAAPADNTIIVVTPGLNTPAAGVGFATTKAQVEGLFNAAGAIAADPTDLGTFIIVTAQDATASTGIANIWFVRDDGTAATITDAADTIQLIGQVNTANTTSATFMTFWESALFDLTP